ncbi:hypothetical protein GGI04_003054 [Coemansia thaxteri]|uniref:Arrestin-like N-terminal domain-containing protein n=1 Tax=Coemansia thaxteri TaxID=2663907 RepID=A0A9W8BA69_9FUNG|nr:hypothetical protein H4R26_004683 [Coemansia thaxteri]KAJ2003192.1 hypothetical protein GGI04_003054 [Coemansia thaxteri]
MSEPVVFEICFPAHITRAPVCRPGETIAGVVVLKLGAPAMASHMVLRFCGMERVRRTPVAQQGTEKRRQTAMAQTMVLDKEIFRREITLWGDASGARLRAVAGGTAHRFHFSFTMPLVNMPTPRQTADVEISYALSASLFTQEGGELRDVHKASSRCFHFEPVLRQHVGAGDAPCESHVALRDSAGRQLAALHVFHAAAACLPGERVELLVVVPAGKRKIVAAGFAVRENVRCRKSSAPVIDEADVPLLWQYAVDLAPPQEMAFAKLARATVAQDVGVLGRYLFTGAMPAPLAPLAEAAEMNSSCETLGAGAYAPLAGAYAPPAVLSPPPPPPPQRTRPRQPSAAAADDCRSERSSISADSLSIRYSARDSRSLSANLAALGRSMPPAPKCSRPSVTPVALGALLAKGSFRFAKIAFTLPPITDMSPVSSVFLDFEYTVDFSVTMAASFGSSKKTVGKLPLKIVTVRSAAKPPLATGPAPSDAAGSLRDLSPVVESIAGGARFSSRKSSSGAEDCTTRSLRDSLSCLNLPLAAPLSSDDNVNPATSRNGSPVNTLTDLHFVASSGRDVGLSNAPDHLSSDGAYPCLRSFVQNGERVPMPELDIINIGTPTI